MENIQEQRIRGYFIDSAKEIIKGEGIRSISVRTVAQRAGYSYATVYNYFKDFKELIFTCIKDFLEECREFVWQANHPAEKGIERLISLTNAYTRYFVQYQGIFELIFLERVPDLLSYEELMNEVNNFLDGILEEDWKFLVESGMISPSDLGHLRWVHKSMVHGQLLFYLNRGNPRDYREFTTKINDSMKFILGEM